MGETMTCDNCSELQRQLDAAKGALSDAVAEIDVYALELRLTAAMCDLVLRGKARMKMDGDEVKFQLTDDV
jgi:hypothetical protein